MRDKSSEIKRVNQLTIEGEHSDISTQASSQLEEEITQARKRFLQDVKKGLEANLQGGNTG